MRLHSFPIIWKSIVLNHRQFWISPAHNLWRKQLLWLFSSLDISLIFCSHVGKNASFLKQKSTQLLQMLLCWWINLNNCGCICRELLTLHSWCPKWREVVQLIIIQSLTFFSRLIGFLMMSKCLFTVMLTQFIPIFSLLWAFKLGVLEFFYHFLLGATYSWWGFSFFFLSSEELDPRGNSIFVGCSET